MNKNLFKRVICLVIALMMIMPNMPMNSVRAEEEILTNLEEPSVESPLGDETPGDAADEQPAGEPQAEEPPAEEPPLEEPPADEPSGEEPSAEEPPTKEPPAEEPPAEEPPLEESPIEEPPANEPPVDESLLEEQPEEFLPGEPAVEQLLDTEEVILPIENDPIVYENPDGLDGPEIIEAPSLIEYDKDELGPIYDGLPILNKRSMLKTMTLSNPDDHDNIEPPAPGSLSINKTASPTAAPNQWKVELTLTGKDIPTTSDIVLVIDRSGSMESNGRLTDAKTAATSFVNTLLNDVNDTSTRIAVVSFAGDVTVHNSSSPFKTADPTEKQTLIDAINGLSASGGTFTQAGLRQASLLLDGSTATNKNIVLLSDGEPTYSYGITNINDYTNLSNRNDYFYNVSDDDWYTRNDLSELVYNSSIVGNGRSILSAISTGWYQDDYYYNHGNSTIAESNFAKNDGQTVYTIALDAGEDGTTVLNGVASPGKAFTGSNDDLEDIFLEIAGSISFAATNAEIADPVGTMFSIPGINSTNYQSLINVNRGTISWNNTTETITWNLNTISEGNPATMWYIVEIDPSAISGIVYPTNGTTYVEYENAYGVNAHKTFPEPEVGINAGTIKVHYYRVNADGQPINSLGDVIAKVDAQLQELTYMDGTPLQLNVAYEVSGPQSVTIGGADYVYNSFGNVGDSNPTTVTLTTQNPSAHVWFGYMEVTESAYKVEHYLEDINADTYTLADTDNMTGTTGALTAAEANTYAGFTVQTFAQETIAADGSTVVKIYYDRNSYTLTYKVTGEYFADDKVAEEFYDYGETVIPLATDMTKEGYTFSGWSEIPGTMPAQDVEVTGSYTINEYNVFYNANGGTGTMYDENNPYKYNSTVTVLANTFTRSNYRFTGWNTAADGSGDAYEADDTFVMPAEDVTLYAQWSRRSDPPIIIPDPDPPLAELEKFDHFAYVIGYPEGDVRPLNDITREEVAMIFYRLLTDESRNALLSDVNPFTDMDQHHLWSNRAVSTLYNAGIIAGYPDGTFRPSDPITRAEFATIAAKFDKLETGSTSKFTDIFGHWAEKYITSSENKGWIKGYPDMTFKPEQDITRAEAMTLINNVLERCVPAENIHPDAIFWPDNPETEWYYEAVMEATNSHDYIYEEDGDELWTGMKPNKVWP